MRNQRWSILLIIDGAPAAHGVHKSPVPFAIYKEIGVFYHNLLWRDRGLFAHKQYLGHVIVDLDFYHSHIPLYLHVFKGVAMVYHRAPVRGVVIKGDSGPVERVMYLIGDLHVFLQHTLP